MNLINILSSLIISVITTLIYLPVKISGGLAGLPKHNGRINGFYLFSNKYNEVTCWDCLNYEVRWDIASIQLIIIFTIVLLILIIVDKRRKKK